MTKQELLTQLSNLVGISPDEAHVKADDLLLKYINDSEITQAFEKIEKWYE